MTPKEIYNQGYALPLYSIGKTQGFRHNNDEYETPMGMVKIEYIGEIPVAKLVDVIEAARAI